MDPRDDLEALLESVAMLEDVERHRDEAGGSDSFHANPEVHRAIRAFLLALSSRRDLATGLADEARVEVAIRYSELRAVVEALTGEPLAVLLERLREEPGLTAPR
ncbi:MAG: hypothetical protein JRS35_28690 [Deltaproteobacteria bacterium]|nr:hypothetical protein [Deltaproteobacteria bacterium]